MFNKVVLVGNLTRDIEMRYGQSGSAIGACAIAVTRKFSVNGEKREEVCFVDITFYGRGAEIANQYLSKGSKVLIEGRLRLEQWTDQNGQNRSKHSIAVENMEMLDSKNSNNSGGNFQNSNFGGAYAGTNSYNQNAENRSFDPYAENQNYKKPAQKPNQNQEKLREIDVDAYDSDDTDLPF